ncbi:MAG TPA: hypothetical protein VNH43_00875 [Vicinamibacteria bacterium]|nr:hypothetical protein [Vicinamibacteria bacterium]
MPRPTASLVLLALAVALVFLGFMLAATSGQFVPQVVDLYLVCQYARALAEGHPFRYNPGDAPSTGATSLLHTALLAVPHAAGIRGEALVAFAIAAGIVFFCLTVSLATRAGRLLGGSREGVLAGVLVAFGGPVVWGFLYGSDIALFMFLAMWLLTAWLEGWMAGFAGRWILPATLLSLARPEGLPLALILAVAWLTGPGRRRRGFAPFMALVPVAAGLAVLALYRAVTGFWLGTSLADKSLIANYGLADSLGLVAEYAIDVVRGLLLGFYPSQAPIGFSRGWAPLYFAPFALVFAGLALVRAPEPFRRPLRIWALAVAVLFLLLAPNMFLGAHFNRYIMWAFPTVHVLTAVGLGQATRLLARDDAALEATLFKGAAVVMAALGALSTLRFAVIYGELAGEISRRDLAAAKWIRDNLPAGTAMANLATSVEYLTGHRSLNLHGVTSPPFFGNRSAEREAGVLEALSRMPPAERPPYLITTVSAQDKYPSMRELEEGPPVFRSSSFGDEIEIYRTRFDLLGRNARFYLPETVAAVQGLQEVDRLNVCDSRDEAAHDYAFRSGLGGLRLFGAPRVAAYGSAQADGQRVADAGRLIIGEESFLVRTPARRDLIIVLRTADSATAGVLRASGSGQVPMEIPEAGIVLRVNGKTAGRVTFRPRPGWDEQVFRITADQVQEGRTRLQLSGRYASFYYWFFQ